MRLAEGAVAADYVRLDREPRLWGQEGAVYIRRPLDDLTPLAQFVKVTEKRPPKELLFLALGSELEHVAWYYVVRTLDHTGISEALDAHGETLLANFQCSVVPDEDLDILRQAGIRHPLISSEGNMRREMKTECVVFTFRKV